MRDIKFRVWDNERNAMLNSKSVDIDFFEGKIEITSDTIRYDEVYTDEIKDFELMQYIGLEDKIGREIYEGDIITITLDTGNVITGSVGMNNGQWSIKYYDRYYSLVSIWYEIKPEVIGNIYENPELIINE